jgi:hypothetical protein
LGAGVENPNAIRATLAKSVTTNNPADRKLVEDAVSRAESRGRKA